MRTTVNSVSACEWISVAAVTAILFAIGSLLIIGTSVGSAAVFSLVGFVVGLGLGTEETKPEVEEMDGLIVRCAPLAIDRVEAE